MTSRFEELRWFVGETYKGIPSPEAKWATEAFRDMFAIVEAAVKMRDALLRGSPGWLDTLAGQELLTTLEKLEEEK